MISNALNQKQRFVQLRPQSFMHSCLGVQYSSHVQRPFYTLPFRTSPTTKHTRLFSQSKKSRPKPIFTQTITPQDSEEEESPQFAGLPESSAYAQQQEHYAPASVVVTESEDMDMDMDDVQMVPSPPSADRQDTSMLSPTAMPSPKSSPQTLLSPYVDSMMLQENANTGRIPTPIYGHFSSTTASSSAEEISPSSLQSDKEIEYDQYLRSRRLPSPISEDEAMEFPPPQSQSKSSESELLRPFPHTTTIRERYGLRTPVRLVQPLSPGLPQKQHGKITFSMGFRADCEMCRNRVPGHSNHIYRA